MPWPVVPGRRGHPGRRTPPRRRGSRAGHAAAWCGCVPRSGSYGRASKVGRANDQSVDVLAEDPTGRRWAVQCKHKQDPAGGKPVGVGVLYALAGTYQRAHDAHLAVVVTNGRFSRDALRWGAEQGVLLVDRTVLARWAADGQPLWDVLPRIPAPRNGLQNEPHRPQRHRPPSGRPTLIHDKGRDWPWN
ncbi:restriction endonuclease [Kitasatospora sp. NPDC087861]|uniref:restriction endonuclease n=1 Tax=unclassified Kitasatospora TaxID=2633591 RepID=UPI00247608D9|nr:restriction endonuclease [Kitasatospora sp. MAA19]